MYEQQGKTYVIERQKSSENYYLVTVIAYNQIDVLIL